MDVYVHAFYDFFLQFLTVILFVLQSNSHAPNLHACIIYIRVNKLPVLCKSVNCFNYSHKIVYKLT